MARPAKLTPDVQAKVAEMLRAGNHVEAAAEAAGISRATFYAWLKRAESKRAADRPYREFAAAVEQAQAEAEARLVVLISRAGAKSWQAAAWLLERQHPERWGRPSERTRDDDRSSESEAKPAPSFLDELAARRTKAA